MRDRDKMYWNYIYICRTIGHTLLLCLKVLEES